MNMEVEKKGRKNARHEGKSSEGKKRGINLKEKCDALERKQERTKQKKFARQKEGEGKRRMRSTRTREKNKEDENEARMNRC